MGEYIYRIINLKPIGYGTSLSQFANYSILSKQSKCCEGSLDAEDEVAQRVSNTDRCHRSSHYCKDLYDESVETGVVSPVYDVDWLDFGHEHDTLERISL